MKPYPSGIYDLLSAPGGNFWQNVTGNASLTRSHVEGFRGRTNWAALQPLSSAPPDWTNVDAALATIAAAGKKLTLSIAAGTTTPAWVYDENPKCTRFLADIGGVPTSMPLPWERHYQNKLFDFIQLFGQKYDKHPAVSGIFFTGFMLADVLQAVKTTADVTLINNAAVAAGYASKSVAWIEAARYIIAQWVRSFPSTPKLLASQNLWGTGTQGNTDKTTIETEGRTNHGDHFGLFDALLKATVSHLFGPPQLNTYPRGAQSLVDSSFQSTFYANPQPTVFPSDPIPMVDLLENAYDNARHLVEVFKFDLDHPANDATFTSKTIKLKSNIGGPNHLPGNIILGAASGGGGPPIPPVATIPKGLFLLPNTATLASGLIDLPLLNHDDIDGIDVGIDWATLAPNTDPATTGNYVFTRLDSLVDQIALKGKPMLLRIATGDDFAIGHKPLWLKTLIDNDPTPTNKKYFTYADADGLSTIVVFWNPILVQKKIEMWQAVANHLSLRPGWPLIKVVALSYCNARTEDFNPGDISAAVDTNPSIPPAGTSPQDRWLTAIQGSGFATWEDAIIDTGKRLYDAIAPAFPGKMITSPIGRINNCVLSPSNLVCSRGSFISDFVTNYARNRYPGRIMSQKNNLNAVIQPANTGNSAWQDLANLNIGTAAQAVWHAYNDPMPAGFPCSGVAMQGCIRMNGNPQPPPPPASFCNNFADTTLKTSVDLGRTYGINYYEVYEIDIAQSLATNNNPPMADAIRYLHLQLTQ